MGPEITTWDERDPTCPMNRPIAMDLPWITSILPMIMVIYEVPGVQERPVILGDTDVVLWSNVLIV
jgi:hypothetical protein